MESLNFYDLAARKKFMTKNYRKTKRNGRHFAVAKSPYTKNECWRVLGK